MALPESIKTEVLEYVAAHVADETWHYECFDYIDDPALAKRLGEEFISTRHIYKILESLSVDDWLLRSQIRIQVISYASIYEAALHHLLFTTFKDKPEVIALTEFPMKKSISIPREQLAVLSKTLRHDGKDIIPTYNGIGKTDESKVRFDKKAECAFSLGLIEDWLRDDLVEFYEARNAIHIHAEIRKSIDYQLDLSKRAYRRLQPFKDQIRARLALLELYTIKE